MNTTRVAHAERCLELLRQARDEAKAAGSPRALERIRRAINSAEGAVRHADGRANHEYLLKLYGDRS